MADPRRIIPIHPAGAPDTDSQYSGCADAEPFALRVIGDSMAPEFQDGHVLVVDPSLPVGHGLYVVVEYEGETTFRQWAEEDGRKFLKALNPNYPAVEITGPFRTIGIVTQRAGKRRADRKHYDWRV